MRRPFRYLPALDERARPCVVKGVVNGRRGQWLGFYVFGSASNGEAQELVLHARWLSEDWMSAMSRARRMARNAKRRFPAGAGNGLFSADTEATCAATVAARLSHCKRERISHVLHSESCSGDASGRNGVSAKRP